MCKYIFAAIAALSIFHGSLSAQQVSDPTTNIPYNNPITPPAVVYPGLQNYSGIVGYNFVRTEIPDKASPFFDGNYVRTTTDYIDGLGRTLQTVKKRAHAEGYDIVTHHVYDFSGKEAFQYLPYAFKSLMVGGLGTNAGKFHPSVLSDLQSFYPAASGESPYMKTEFDNSPLDRVKGKFNPGVSWVGAGRGSGFSYGTNGTADNVRVWAIGPNNTDLPVSSGAYAAGALQMEENKDEDGKSTIVYKDKNGRIVLSKRPLVDNPTAGHASYACTYFVYDDHGKLRFIIPPKAVEAIDGTWTLGNVLDLCYTNFYDEQGNLVERKVPGKAVEYYVYDKRNRRIMDQDGNLRSGSSPQWRFVIYDALDRPVISALCTTPESRTQMVDKINDGTTYAAPHWLYYLKNYSLFGEYPGTITNCQILTYSYYDNYDNLQQFAFDPNQFSSISLPPGNIVMPSALSNQTKGLLTGMKSLITDPDNPTAANYLLSVNYYDDNGRVIQTQLKNHKGGTDISSNLYYFQGKLWKNIFRHHNPAAIAVPGTTDGPFTQLSLKTTYERNIVVTGGNEEVSRITQQINTGTVFPLTNYFYDHLDRTTVKQSPAAEILNEFSVRGLLTHIDAANGNNTDSAHLFEENVYFANGFKSQNYNGNISGITWRKAGSLAPVESYGYNYDKLDRLTHAEYRRQPIGSSLWSNLDYDYTASNMVYDRNGNIQSMNQKGINQAVSANPILIDQLSYSYAANSNSLLSVADAIANSNTTGLPDFKNGTNSGNDYAYDPNGNLSVDGNKGISSISYNFTDRPAKVLFQNNNSITFVYDPIGNLLQKRVHDAQLNTTDTFDYLGAFIYKNGLLQYISNDEGRARPVNENNQTKYRYDYYIKDHLGNVRTTVSAQPMDQLYMAAHELAQANIEQLVFDNIPAVRSEKPGSNDPDDHMAAELDGADPSKTVGTAIMLKTMPGDRFTISVNAYYEGDYRQRDNTTPEAVVGSLMGALTNGINYDGIPLGELPDNIRTIQSTLSNPELADQLNSLLDASNNTDAPKAHLNILFFDDKFRLDMGASRIVQVAQNGGNGGWVVLNPSNGVPCCHPGVSGGGYVLIYVDNQSIGKKVWFDNLFIDHYTGKVQEENHYYPYGLTLRNAQGVNQVKQPLKFQSVELEDDFGFETYRTFYRLLDPQIGRFKQVDPKADLTLFQSPYASMDNNPAGKTDPMGDVAGGDGDGETGHKPTRFEMGLASLFTMFTTASRAVQPPWSDANKRLQSKEPTTLNEDIEDLKSGMDWAFILATPVEMVSSTSLPVNAEAKLENTLLQSDLRVSRQTIGFKRPTTTLFHYTSEEGYNAIMSSGMLNPSVGEKNARFGIGQYLTDIRPGTAQRGQVSARLYGIPWQKNKLSHFIEIDVSKFSVVKNKSYNFLIRNNNPLPLNGIIVSHGRTWFIPKPGVITTAKSL